LKKIKVGLPASIVADQPSFLPSVLEEEGRAASERRDLPADMFV
jgi:hypothetical protein